MKSRTQKAQRRDFLVEVRFHSRQAQVGASEVPGPAGVRGKLVSSVGPSAACSTAIGVKLPASMQPEHNTPAHALHSYPLRPCLSQTAQAGVLEKAMARMLKPHPGHLKVAAAGAGGPGCEASPTRRAENHGPHDRM